MDNLLPWKHPTTTLVLDDSRSFLESMELALPKKNRRLLFVTRPEDAIKLINDSTESIKNSLGSAKPSDKYSKIPEMANFPRRSWEVSAAIVDYHMPAMNGIEFCSRIRDTMCQKILLTANSDEKIAIRAFNQGLIHLYLRKQDPDIDDLLHIAIKQAENKYFANKFNAIISSIEQNNQFFKNKNLQNLLEDFLKKEDIIEHYISDQNGSIFCINNDGSTSNIFVKNKEDIRIPLTWIDSESLPQKTAQEIQECKKMLCFSMDDTNFPPTSLWEKYLVPTTQIPNEPEYFIAILKNHSGTNLPQDLSPVFWDDREQSSRRLC